MKIISISGFAVTLFACATPTPPNERTGTSPEAIRAAEERFANKMPWATDHGGKQPATASARHEGHAVVITFSGSVLFASNQATLLPAAQTLLRETADALLTISERDLVIEGHTDSQGSDRYNLDLSQRRADAVRSYLIFRGYDADSITAHGIGRVQPVADNKTAQGRAENRRVEIVLAPEDRVTR